MQVFNAAITPRTRQDRRTIDRFIAKITIEDTDPEYLLARMMISGLEPPIELADKAHKAYLKRREQYALSIRDTKERTLKHIAYAAAIEKKVSISCCG